MSDVGRHLAAAVERHRRWCRDNAIPVPRELFTLVEIVSSRQEPSCSPDLLAPSDDAGVPIALDFTDAGRLLGVSRSSVERLVKRGELRSCLIGAARRIPRSELLRLVAERTTT